MPIRGKPLSDTLFHIKLQLYQWHFLSESVYFEGHSLQQALSWLVLFCDMNREQRNLIERFGPQIIEDVIPVDMLPYLLCLTHGDKEVIAHEETRFGPMRAAQELLSRLRRRPDGFEQFLQALNATGCAHLADLLDPREQGNCLDDVTSKIMVEINNNCVKRCNSEKFLIR